MLDRTAPDCVIVTTVDAIHHVYVIQALRHGCDVIVEKPMTTDAEKCRQILRAVEDTGRGARVTFNYRWGAGPTRVKQLIRERTIGEIIHVDLEYWLDTHHGADYFRRWHRDKDKSGGLIVHKATHHFDLVNWWIDSVPETVFAMGKLGFYGRANAEKRGVEVSYDRYTGSEYQGDPFALDLNWDDRLKQLYLDSEKYDGYRRDMNVFGDDITSEDSMSVLVRYRGGAVLNYSLNAYLPVEGFRVVFSGTEGRIEYSEVQEPRVRKEGTVSMGGDRRCHLTVQRLFEEAHRSEIPFGKGGHGGADPLLQEKLFSASPARDVWGRSAGHGQGAASMLVGAAANQSMEAEEPVRISRICPELGSSERLSDLP
jgi:predicted dehydrogenase